MTSERLAQLKTYVATWTNPYDKVAAQELIAAVAFFLEEEDELSFDKLHNDTVHTLSDPKVLP